jgi:hypothetical protein
MMFEETYTMHLRDAVQRQVQSINFVSGFALEMF